MNGSLGRVVVINDDSVASGGAASIALASIRLLRSRGVPVTLLTGDEGPNPHLALWGAEVVSLGGQHLLAGSRAAAALRGLHDSRTRAALKDWIHRNDTPDTVYHLHNWHKILSASCFAPLRKVAARLVISTHDFFLACPNGGYFNYPHGHACDLRPLSPACLVANCDKRHYGHKLWRLGRHVIRQAAFDLRDTRATVLAVHDGMRPLLERGGIAPNAISVMRNPVAPWCRRRVTAERNNAVLFVGRLELDKGVDTLALASLKVGARLKVVGEGSLRDFIRQLCPAADLLGAQTPSALAEIARNSRMLVLPSRVRETFGLVALEAAMSGVPVVASTSALITEELVHVGAARPCPPGDAGILAERISALLNDDAAIGAMSRAGFQRAPQLAPSEDDWCMQLIDLYEHVLASSKTSPLTWPALGAGGAEPRMMRPLRKQTTIPS